jgi:hypothetical protein
MIEQRQLNGVKFSDDGCGFITKLDIRLGDGWSHCVTITKATKTSTQVNV